MSHAATSFRAPKRVSWLLACGARAGGYSRGLPPILIRKVVFVYEYGRGIPGAAPDTRSACRHEAGHCGNRRDASALSPVFVTPPGAQRGWRVEAEWLPLWATPVAARCPRAAL